MTEFTAIESRTPLRLRPPLMARHQDSRLYRPAPGLREAMDLAMLLGVPLLLTGDPGVGKTRAAWWLADELATDLLSFDVKSSTAGSDLLYSFDEVGRFRDASAGNPDARLVRYLRLNALGRAILLSVGSGAPIAVGAAAGPGVCAVAGQASALENAFGAIPAGGAQSALLLPDEPPVEWSSPRHSVVLIDELDKAPRDTPNDLLAEIENMTFSIVELGLKVVGAPEFRPIVIITSNSEKSLPAPFLRRCVYFNIPFPSEEQLKELLDETLGGAGGSSDRAQGGLLDDAIQAVLELRRDADIVKPPGTAELLAWVDVLAPMVTDGGEGALKRFASEEPERFERTLGVVIKSREETAAALRTLRRWAG